MTTWMIIVLVVVLALFVLGVLANEVRVYRRARRPTIMVEIRGDALKAERALDRVARDVERIGRLQQ